MKRATSPEYGSRPLRLGAKGRDVWELQLKLIGWGSGRDRAGIGAPFDPVRVCGRFDQTTVDAVMRFQQAHGLAVTGEVGARTFHTIDAEPARHPIPLWDLRCPCAFGKNTEPILCRCQGGKPHPEEGPCGGFGNGRFAAKFLLDGAKDPALRAEQLDVYDMQEYPGVDKALLWAVRAVMHRAEIDGIWVAAGYRCWHDNYHATDDLRWHHRRATFNFGKALSFILRDGCSTKGNPCAQCARVRRVALDQCGFQLRWHEPGRPSVAEGDADARPPASPYAVHIDTVRRTERALDDFVKSDADAVKPTFPGKLVEAAFPLRLGADELDPRFRAAEEYFDMTEAPQGGWFPLGKARMWHGGVHLYAPQNEPVHAIVSGEVVGCRVGEAMHAHPHGARNFVLLRHRWKDRAFFTLTMHLDDEPANASASVAWRRALYVRTQDHVEALEPAPIYRRDAGRNALVPLPGLAAGERKPVTGVGNTRDAQALDASAPPNSLVVALAHDGSDELFFYVKREGKDVATLHEADAALAGKIAGHEVIGLKEPIAVAAAEPIGKVPAAPADPALAAAGCFVHLEAFADQNLFGTVEGVVTLEVPLADVADRKKAIEQLIRKGLVRAPLERVLTSAGAEDFPADRSRGALRSAVLKMPSAWALDWQQALASAPSLFLKEAEKSALGAAYNAYRFWDEAKAGGAALPPPEVHHHHPIALLLQVAFDGSYETEDDDANAAAEQAGASMGSGEGPRRFAGCGGAGACPEPPHGGGGAVTAGDPIDVLTGRVFVAPTTELALGGPLPLVIRRFYSSHARRRDVGLGPGWSHSFATKIEWQGSQLRIWNADGQFEMVDAPLDGRPRAFGSRAIEADGVGFVVREDARSYTYRPAGDDPACVLVAIADAYGNEIELTYDARGGLSGAVDSVGREVRVRRHDDGKIAAFEVRRTDGRFTSFFAYRYDADGHLVAVTDGAGHVTEHAYEDDRLVRTVAPSGRVTHFRYDDLGRCFETWIDHGGAPERALDERVPATLADGAEARGVLHARVHRHGEEAKLVDSCRVTELAGNDRGLCEENGTTRTSYDADGNRLSYTDPTGATWRWQRDDEGRVVAVVDPLGQRAAARRDELGRVVERSDALGAVTALRYNDEDDVVEVRDGAGLLVAFEYDERGLLVAATQPNGGRTTCAYDAMGNRVAVVEPDGATRRMEYDDLGRLVAFTNERGERTALRYDARGLPCASSAADGSSLTLDHDPNGDLARLTFAPGPSDAPAGAGSPSDVRVTELHYGGYREVHEIRRPDGARLRFRYDREGRLTRVTNGAGETHGIDRDASGRVVAEHTFDGRTIGYEHDAAGRIARVRNATCDIAFSYDAAGRVVRRACGTDLSESFGYDAVGRMVSAESGAARCRFDYDARGNLARETQTLDDETHVVERAFDAEGHAIALRTSLGHELAAGYDSAGRVAWVELPGEGRVSFAFDGTGRERERSFPSGARLRYEHDACDRRVIRALVPAPGAQPAFHEVVSRRADGLIASVEDAALGTTRYTYDVCGRVIGRDVEDGSSERYAYDEGENLHEAGAPRRYGRGGALEAKGDVRWFRDAEGRVVERRNGNDVWRYGWNARGLLTRMWLPDGRAVVYRYDALARRVEKLIHRPEHLESRTRYVWCGDELVHAIETRHGESVEHSYAVVPGSPLPFAERKVPAGETQRSEARWVFHLTEATGRPLALFDGDGRIIARARGKLWGDVEPARFETALRFAGHYADAESGLFYNRHRYYDPDTGTYLSPEPAGLEGGILPYAYARQNPVNAVDRNGLMEATVTGAGLVIVRANQEEEGERGEWVLSDTHPVVADLTLAGFEAVPGNISRDGLVCAEPRAISDYLYAYEEKHGMAPGELAGNRKKLRSALRAMSIGAWDGDQPRAPCANCSQLLAGLMQAHGGPRPKNVMAGARTSNTKDESKYTNFTAPRAPKKGKKQPKSFHLGYPTDD